MHVIVVGGGLMGVTTAYYLNLGGHAVTLVDRREVLAGEGSHANGGILHAGHADPWNTPAALRQLARSLVRGDTALRLRYARLPAMAGWGARFVWHCRAADRERVTEANTRLAVWSRRLLRTLAQEAGIEFDAADRGSLKIFTDAERLDHAAASARRVEALGVHARYLDPSGVIELEPSLAAVQARLAGGLYFPEDGSGDAARFSQALGDVLARRGVALHLGERVQGLAGDGTGVDGVVTDGATLRGDAVVLANGVDAPTLARPLGLRLPIEPVKGYSATLALGDAASREAAPQTAIIDEARQVVMARLGERLRVAGMAELAGFDRSVDAQAIARILNDALASIPRLGERVDRAQASTWACLRPVSADGAPLLGPTRIPGLYLNTGAGHLGWTLAAAAGQLVAQTVTGEAPDMPLESLSAARFGG